ncbi:MAG TPA: TPM domain-containing protein [Aliicoccus persicus]|uniref:TPM domain-containing protein n=1 Tax=Aliicoccus persicus TaxID=930138 RepID=A0A921DXL6_9STAP|nr:TPM domain-containing protein [Aliicoccus persicus]
MIKKLFLLLLMSVVFIPSIQAEDLPPLDTTHYFVQDNANVLSEESVRALNDLGTHLESGTGVEMLLLTMPTTGQIHRQDYALEALRGYGVGKEDEDNGIVILLNLDNGNEFTNRGVDVQVGYGVEGYLNDAKIGRIIDQEALDYFQRAAEFENNSSQANRYYEQGLIALYEALYNESLEAFGYEDGEFTRDTPIEDSSDGSGFSGVGEIFRLFITLIFIIFVLWMIRGGGGGTGGRSRGRRGTFWGFPTGGSGGGSFGGGSSGGFGGFGGGSGGGGGAGRGF